MLFAAACAMLSACNSNGKTAANASGEDSTVDSVQAATADSAIYTGIMPAADCFGIRYHVAIAKDSTNGFDIEEAYMKSENEVDTARYYKGIADIIKSKDGKKTYYSFDTDGSESIKFLILNDSTLRMVSADLQEPVAKEGMSYDLKLTK